MEIVQKDYDVAVIVGRFQVPRLHEGHHELIRSVQDLHGPPIIILGAAPILGSIANPLPFSPRKAMLQEDYPDATILYIKDTPSNALWSQRLDELISDVVKPGQSVVLYGGRDSFVQHYEGRYDTRELSGDRWISGTEIRKMVGNRPRNSEDWRAGVCWGTGNRYPTCYATVDVAVFNEEGTKLLLARKHDEDLLRFIGGFSDPRSASYEADARREVQEEAGISITDPQYVTSLVVDDWRYRDPETDKIKTLLFVAKHQFGNPKGADDVAEVRFVDWGKLREEDLVEAHRPLLAALRGHLSGG